MAKLSLCHLPSQNCVNGLGEDEPVVSGLIESLLDHCHSRVPSKMCQPSVIALVFPYTICGGKTSSSLLPLLQTSLLISLSRLMTLSAFVYQCTDEGAKGRRC
jgi:hypothetical protein